MEEDGLYPYWSRVMGKPTVASLRDLHCLRSPLGVDVCWYLEGANRPALPVWRRISETSLSPFLSHG